MMMDMPPEKLRMGEVLRYARPYSTQPPIIDDLRNFFNVTYNPQAALPIIDKGINGLRNIVAPEGLRRPAILISSSPHKVGSSITPWQDFFDTDNGHIRYYGDNKDPAVDPASRLGNATLLKAFEVHRAFSAEDRRNAVPLIFFRRVSSEGRRKGYVLFDGFGIIERVELKVQYDHANLRTFTNYVFDFLVMSLARENELFDWSWIKARQDPSINLSATSVLAPASWRFWLKEGEAAYSRSRRRVSKLLTLSSGEQRPAPSSSASKILDEVYEFYRDRKSRFEALAAVISGRVIGGTGSTYRQGWITPSSSDGGADFIGRLDIGSNFSKTKLVVLGQAKCERPDAATGGNHIARTVARLKRGWVGIYVTTGYFSEQVQREVIEDQYPIILVHGLRLAEEVSEAVYQGGFATVRAFLEYVDAQYENLVAARRPEEILFD